MDKEVNRWKVGDVQITRIIEFESGGFPPGFMFDGLTEERVKSIDWLHSDHADADGTITRSDEWPSVAKSETSSVKCSNKFQWKKATITGDVLLNPIQLADPEIGSNFDFDKTLAKKTRQHFIYEHTDQDILVLGTHFTTPSGGYIATDGDVWRFVPALVGTGNK